MIAELNGTILVVEDDQGVAVLEKRHLERAGYGVALASTAQEALERLARQPVDLILLDYRLPGELDGLAFYDRVRAAGFDMPVILVTGHSTEATVIKALRLGVRDFVTKSLEYLDYLPEAVGRVLKQVRTEHQLAESEARLACIISSAKDAIIVVTHDQRITLFNPAAEQMFGCSVGEALGRPLRHFIPREYDLDHDSTAEAPVSVMQYVRTGTQGVRASGEIFSLEASVSRGKLGNRKFYTVIVRDVTERKRMETRLQEQAALLDQARDAIMVRDMNDCILFWSRGAERLYGWTSAEAVGKVGEELLYRLHTPELEEAHRRVFEKGEWIGELRQVNKQGQEVIVESRRTLLRDEQGRARAQLVINTDITEKKKLEAQYLHIQRMESIGVLAGGVAHDFNNLLTVINGYSELLLSQLPPEDTSRPVLTAISQAGERAAALTRQLLAFSRKLILVPQVFNLNTLVVETHKLLARLIGEDVKLETVFAPALGLVKADLSQIEQVILNLVVNARDAMPTGGRLTIETKNVKLDESYTRTHAEVQPGSYVLLTVSDTGSGIEESIRSQIFQPFFTTKEVGKGTGLGLATVYGIVKQSGGYLDFDSEPGRGTTFKIYLPRLAEEPTPLSVVVPNRFTVSKGTETVLLAEDEEGVRLMIRLALETNGYTVLLAADGDAAIELSRNYPKAIDLLVSDVVMPGMGGRQLADRLSAARPKMKVLFLSGYTDDAVIHHGVLDAETAFLQKPFTPTILAKKVREVLDKGGAR